MKAKIKIKQKFFNVIKEFFLYVGFIGGIIAISYKNKWARSALKQCRVGYWSIRVGKIGQRVTIESNVNIRGNTSLVEIGDFSFIDINVQFEVYKPIKIGKYVHITPNVYIQSGEEVIIGDYACVANGSIIYASSNTYKLQNGDAADFLISMSSSSPIQMQSIKYGKVIIGDYAFIGMGSIILPGVNIGKGAIIGAGSIVIKDIPPYTIAFGTPAKPMYLRKSFD